MKVHRAQGCAILGRVTIERRPHVDGPSLPYLIHRIARRLDNRINRLAKADGLKVEGIRILLRLWADDGQRVGDLAAATSIEQSALSHMLSRMESAGLVARGTVSGEGRSVTVSLTPSGRRKAQKYGPLFRDMEEASLEGLPAAERRRLKKILNDVYVRLADQDER
jgi:DNA-binding MarR family transcriptional regulator